MILLDTNVISEPLRRAPAPEVVSWLDRQALETLHLSAITVAELRFGVETLPRSQRRDVLNDLVEDQVLPRFRGRIADFDEHAARESGRLRALARRHGVAVGIADSFIAATALALGFTVATRDTAPFEFCGVTVIDPFAP